MGRKKTKRKKNEKDRKARMHTSGSVVTSLSAHQSYRETAAKVLAAHSLVVANVCFLLLSFSIMTCHLQALYSAVPKRNKRSTLPV